MYRALFKIWHALMAFVVTGLLATVLLRKTFLNKKINGALIQQKLDELLIDINLSDAIDIAITMRNVMWKWHLYLGYALVFLIVYRTLLYFFDKRDKMSFAEVDLHKKAIRILYLLFYVFITLIAISGLLFLYQNGLGISEEVARSIKSFHELLYNYFLFFVPLHIAGIVVADIVYKDGIPSSITRPNKG